MEKTLKGNKNRNYILPKLPCRRLGCWVISDNFQLRYVIVLFYFYLFYFYTYDVRNWMESIMTRSHKELVTGIGHLVSQTRWVIRKESETAS